MSTCQSEVRRKLLKSECGTAWLISQVFVDIRSPLISIEKGEGRGKRRKGEEEGISIKRYIVSQPRRPRFWLRRGKVRVGVVPVEFDDFTTGRCK